MILLNWLKRKQYFGITSGSAITHQRLVFFLRLEKTRLDYHYALRKLKNEDLTLRYEKMYCRVLKNNSKDFWKEVHKIRGNAKMLINSVDGVQGQDIADLFADKYDILYNSVSYDNTDMVTLKTDIDKCIRCKRNNIESEHKVITVQDVETCIASRAGANSGPQLDLLANSNSNSNWHHYLHNIVGRVVWEIPWRYFPGSISREIPPQEILPKVEIPGNTGKYKTLALFSCFILCLIADLLLLSIFSMDLR